MKLPKQLRHFLTEYRWALVGAAGLVAFTLGFFGYREWLTNLHQHDPVTAPAPGVLDEIFDRVGQRSGGRLSLAFAVEAQRADRDAR